MFREDQRLILERTADLRDNEISLRAKGRALVGEDRLKVGRARLSATAGNDYFDNVTFTSR